MIGIAVEERRFTLDELASMLAEPTRDDAYTRTRLGPAVADYLSWKRNEDGAAARTIDTYERVLAQLAVERFSVTVATLTIDDLRAVRDLRPPASRRLVTAVYKDFCKWLYQEGRTETDVAGRLRYPRVDKSPVTGLFTDEEKAQIVAAQTTIMDRLCVLLLLRAGVRKGELRHLQVRDVDLVEKLILVRRGKGGKPRRIPIRGSLIRAFDEYLLTPIPRLDVEPQPDFYVLYTTAKNRHGIPDPTRPLAESTAHRWWYRCLQLAEIVEPDATSGRRMHTTRHTFATDVGKATDWNMVAVQKLMGHSKIGTTVDTYTQFAFDEQEAAIELLPEIET